MVDGQAVIGEKLGAVGAKEGSNVSNDLHLKNTLLSTYNVSAKVMLKSFWKMKHIPFTQDAP